MVGIGGHGGRQGGKPGTGGRNDDRSHEPSATRRPSNSSVWQRGGLAPQESRPGRKGPNASVLQSPGRRGAAGGEATVEAIPSHPGRAVHDTIEDTPTRPRDGGGVRRRRSRRWRVTDDKMPSGEQASQVQNEPTSPSRQDEQDGGQDSNSARSRTAADGMGKRSQARVLRVGGRVREGVAGEQWLEERLDRPSRGPPPDGT